jgi:short-subunit dehydrogenase
MHDRRDAHSFRQGCRGVIDTAVAQLGGLDVLILNHIIGYYDDWAARVMRGHVEGTLEKDLSFVDQIFSINTLSYIYLSSYALPELAKASGKIIAVGSAAGKQGLPRVAPYAATKHAVFGYFDSLRHDLIASPDPSLARVTVTTGVLGSFDTETAREGTGGKLDSLVVWSPPADAASALLKAGARRWRTVYVPWEQTRIITLLHPLMPELMDWVIRRFMIPA